MVLVGSLALAGYSSYSSVAPSADVTFMIITVSPAFNTSKRCPSQQSAVRGWTLKMSSSEQTWEQQSSQTAGLKGLASGRMRSLNSDRSSDTSSISTLFKPSSSLIVLDPSPNNWENMICQNSNTLLIKSIHKHTVIQARQCFNSSVGYVIGLLFSTSKATHYFFIYKSYFVPIYWLTALL